MRLLKDRSPGSRKRAILTSSTFISAIANTIALLLIARNMGPEILGSLAFMLSFIGLFFFVGDMGNALAFSRLLDKGHRFADCYSAFLMAKIKLTVLMGIIAGALIGVYVFLLAPEGHTPLHPMSMFVILGYFLLANIAQIWVVSLAERKRVVEAKAYDILESLAKVVMVGAIVWLGLAHGDQYAVVELSVIYLLAAILGLAVVRNSARKFRLRPVSDEITLAFIDTSKEILPFVAFGALVLNLDKVLLWYFTDFESLGLYFGAQRITIFIGASALAIQGIVFGAITRHLKNGDRASLSDTLRMTERYVALLAMPVTAFYIFFSQDIVMAFLGDNFVDAGMAISLLAGAGMFTALASPHVIYLIADEKYKELASFSGLALLALLVPLFILVPDSTILPSWEIHGINGAAIALLLSSMVGFLGYRAYTYRHLGCRPHPKILAHVFSAGLMVVVQTFIGWYFTITDPLHRVLTFTFVGIFVYSVALYLTGEFLRKDYKRFKDLARDK